MGKINFFLLAISLGLLTLFNGCGFPNSHRLDETLYYFKNETTATIYLTEYTHLTAGDIWLGTKYSPNEELIVTAGGHFEEDSVIIYKTVFIDPNIVKTDSIIYRNPNFGDDISHGNHFFNPKRWLQLEETKFVYAVQEADFD